MRRILATAAALLLVGGASSSKAEPVGFVAVANGDVQLQQGNAWQAASRDAEVSIGDVIRTGTDSSAKIVLVDDTLLQVDEDTEFRIETWHVGQAATREVSIVRQAHGRLRATVGDAFGGTTRMEVHIPTAAIGIKGTDFETVEGPTWEACLLSGGIRVANHYGAATPAPGQCVYAYPDRAPGDAHPNPRTPLEVSEGGATPPVLSKDFAEPIQTEVGAPGEPGSGEQPQVGPGKSPVGDPYDSTTGNASEDELGVQNIPEPQPNLD